MEWLLQFVEMGELSVICKQSDALLKLLTAQALMEICHLPNDHLSFFKEGGLLSNLALTHPESMNLEQFSEACLVGWSSGTSKYTSALWAWTHTREAGLQMEPFPQAASRPATHLKNLIKLSA